MLIMARTSKRAATLGCRALRTNRHMTRLRLCLQTRMPEIVPMCARFSKPNLPLPPGDYVDGQATVYIRWGHIDVTGGDNFSSMSVDDVLIRGICGGANTAPTVTLHNTASSLPQDTDTTNRIKVADIRIHGHVQLPGYGQ